jgi:hypothetical protein
MARRVLIFIQTNEVIEQAKACDRKAIWQDTLKPVASQLINDRDFIEEAKGDR